MKRKLLSMALLAISALGFHANAQEDVTNDYLKNADLSVIDSDWTVTNKEAWKNDGDVPAVEFYAGWTATPQSMDRKDFKFSQTITLPAGDYRIAVNAFYRNGDPGDDTNNDRAWIFATGTTEGDGGKKMQNVYALGNAGVASFTGSDDLHKAANAFSLGNFSNEFDFTVAGEGDQEVEVGFEGYFDLTKSWCILGPVKLYKYTLDAYINEYNEKVAEAEALYGSKMNAEVLATLKAAAEFDAESATKSDEITAAIKELSDAIVAANASISAYAAALPAIEKAEKIIAETNIFAAEAKEAYQNAIDAARTAYSDGTLTNEEANALEVNLNGGTNYKNPDDPMRPFYSSAWSATNGVSVYTNNWSAEITNDNFSVPYVEDWLDNTNLANTTISASIANLDKGTYTFKAKVRVRSAANGADVNVEGISVQASLGEPVAITGTANDIVNGQNFYLTDVEATGYVLDDNGTLKIDFTVENTNASWLLIKAANYEFVSADVPDDLGAATESDYEALNAAIAAAEKNTLGFDAGEYAPYNNIEAIAALNAAKAIDPTVANMQEDVQAATDALTDANWTVNEEEVNAVYDGNFAIAPISAESGDADKDITWWTTTNSMRKVFDSTEENCAQIASSTSGKGLFAWNGSCTYGKIEGYTMPLAAHTIYELNVKYAGWQTGAVNNFTVSVSDANETVISKNLGTANGINTTLASTGKLLFTTGEAGDYTLTVSGSGNFIFTDVTLYKAPATQTVEVSAAGYATFSSEYPLDLSNIEDGTAYIVADDAEGEYIKLTEQTNAVPANTGLIIAGEGTVTIPVAVTGVAPETNYLKAGTGAQAPVDSYVFSWKDENPETAGFYVVTEAAQPTVEKGKAYLQLPEVEEGEEPVNAKVLRFVFGDGTATAVEAIEVAEADADGAIYNVAGQQVGKDYKGIVIKNGKKYLNK